MKNLLSIVVLLLIVACDSDKSNTTTETTKISTSKNSAVTAFIKNPKSLADFNHPIETFKE